MQYILFYILLLIFMRNLNYYGDMSKVCINFMYISFITIVFKTLKNFIKLYLKVLIYNHLYNSHTQKCIAKKRKKKAF